VCVVPELYGSIMMSTDCHTVTKRKLAAGFIGDFGAVASGWWPPQGRHGRGSRRPAQAWAGPLGTARRHSGAAERPTLNGANHRSALPVAVSGSSDAAWARLDGSIGPRWCGAVVLVVLLYRCSSCRYGDSKLNLKPPAPMLTQHRPPGPAPGPFIRHIRFWQSRVGKKG
jgi:hypothetical protein